ncbi:MAG: 3-deoxy-manno-octulosonate cytidylyltransferase [Crocinitomicaceae bacterium]|jgi:3-deoxy-manno-octulosonate cytidylyltransferase (CMP-KDO synthetase)
MKVLGIIPARYASSRFPGKPLIDLKGKSMIQRVYEGALKSQAMSKVIVATDDQRIVDEVLRFGGHVCLTKASHLSGTDRCAEVAEMNPGFDVVINIQGDEPLVNPSQLDQLLHAFKEPEVQIATLGIHTTDKADLINPNRIKVVCDHASNALYFSRSTIPNHDHFNGDHLAEFPYLRHIGLYAYRTNTLAHICQLKPTQLERIESLEQLRWLFHGLKIKVVLTDIETPNIDVPEDVEKVLQFL